MKIFPKQPFNEKQGITFDETMKNVLYERDQLVSSTMSGQVNSFRKFIISECYQRINLLQNYCTKIYLFGLINFICNFIISLYLYMRKYCIALNI